MKKALAILLIVLGMSTGLHAQSLEQGNSRFHAHGTYGLRWKNFGYGGGVEFFFVDNFAIMPSFTFLQPDVGKGSNFSMDLRYYISDGPSQLFFLAGYSQSWQNTQPGDPGVRQSYKGANIGVGTYIRLVDWVGLNTEFRFQSQTPREAGFRFGLAFPL